VIIPLNKSIVFYKKIYGLWFIIGKSINGNINVFNSKSKANGIFVNVSEGINLSFKHVLDHFIISKHEKEMQLVYNDWTITN